MSTEIDPVFKGSEARDVPSYDLFIPRNTGVKVDLIGGNHQMRHFVDPKKGHKHVTQLNPTPTSVWPLLEKIKEPSVLWLRGCESLLRADFPFLKFKALTSLEISGCSNLTTLPEKEISEMSQLQSLNLSHLGITKLPHDFLSNLTNLRSLVLRGCSNLDSLPDCRALRALECLDLSGMLIETLPDGFFSGLLELRWIILRGCSRLRSLPSTEPLSYLEVLDLSHCTTLQEMDDYNEIIHLKLEMLDLSYTALPRVPQIETLELTHMFLRGTKVNVFQPAHDLLELKILDLSGAQNLNSISLRSCYSLVILDLSRTAIEFIDSLSSSYRLVKLILRECLGLVRLPAMEDLMNLEVLDISGCEILDDLPEDLESLTNLKELHLSGCCCLRELREGLFDEMSNLEILDLSKTNVNHLPSVASLTNLKTLNLSQTSIHKVPNSSYLVNLKEFVPPGSDGIDCIRRVQYSCGIGNHQENLESNSDKFHLVSTFISDSGFDRFKYGFEELDDLISNIEKNITTTKKRNITSTRADLKYILEKIDILESSRNCSASEELLLELMNAASNLSADDFPLYSKNTSALIRAFAKLKLLIPPPNKKMDSNDKDMEKKKKKKKKKPLFTKIKDEENAYSMLHTILPELQNEALMQFPEWQHLYESLTDIQRNCLLYFALFSYSTNESILGIKERILIQLWYGEGFIDPVVNQVSQHGSTSKAIEYKNTIKETGQQILEVLEEKRFITHWDNGIWHMEENVHDFVKELAKEVHFFNFDNNNGKLTPHFVGSQRACLLKSQDPRPSSCNLWRNYMDSAEKLESFQKIQTLLYVNEPIIDIKREWFSNMTNLCVLHLSSLHWLNEEQIDIVDLQFLEELINMKQLRLLSLEGFAALKKLPDSISKLTNLKLLNLSYCSNLEELPNGIGSLGNLTHLDLTQCHLLSELPKEVRLLSKLEVLKGFMITYKVGGRQSSKACTLQDLLNLENLRKLSLVVNKDTFPESMDLRVLREMENLYNLKITWRKNCYMEKEEPKNVTKKRSLRHSRLQLLKCWEQHRYQSDMEEDPLRSSNFENLTKLVLCCFPLKTSSNWLHQGQFQKLQKLYIVGGSLKTLPGDINQSAWNIKTLRLKYLPNLEMDEEGFKYLFLNVSQKLVYKCPLVASYELQSE